MRDYLGELESIGGLSLPLLARVAEVLNKASDYVQT